MDYSDPYSFPPMPQGPQGAKRWGDLSPQEQEELVSAGGVPQQMREDRIARQFAIADALRQKAAGTNHVSPLGGAFGAIADTINAGNSKLTGDNASADQNQMRSQLIHALVLANGLMGGAPNAQPMPGADADDWAQYPGMSGAKLGTSEDR